MLSVFLCFKLCLLIEFVMALELNMPSHIFNNLVFNEIEFFSYLNVYLVILFVLLTLFMSIIWSTRVKGIHSIHGESSFIELFISFGSVLILLLVICPSLVLLFETELIMTPSFIVYAMGQQWMWSFDVQYYNCRTCFDVITLPVSNSNSNLFLGTYFTVSSFVIIPFLGICKFLVYALDVIHSLGIYSLGIKVDAIPGRLNVCASIRPLFKGELYGWCYELCGAGHSNMLMKFLVL